jgi:pilus assembly protein Flp/PilA
MTFLEQDEYAEVGELHQPLGGNMKIRTLLHRVIIQLATDERGQDLIEYALLAGMVAVAAGAIFPTTIAPNISTIFSKIQHTLGLA